MRPLTLTLHNIGPFRSQTINFEELGDIFLICGKTGAGKSTIFDAMTYALYGRLPGTRTSVTGRQLRSDFCQDDEEAFVSLRFALKGRCLTATRKLPRTYVNRNGRKSEKPEELVVTCIENETETPVGGSITELNAFLSEQIGLTAAEFARIVLLPQGDFADFLLQSSTDRAATLAKLFPVQKYEDITQKAKELCTKITAELDTVMQQLEPFGPEFNAEAERHQIDEMEKSICSAERNQNSLKQQQIELENLRERLSDKLSRFDEQRKLKQELAEYESRRQKIENAQARLERAKQAEPAAIASDEARRLQGKCAEVDSAVSGCQATRSTAMEKLAALSEREPELEEKSAQYEGRMRLLQDIQRAAGDEQRLSILALEKDNHENALRETIARIEILRQQRERTQSQLAQISAGYSSNDAEILAEELQVANAALHEAATNVTRSEQKENLEQRAQNLQQECESQRTAASELKKQLEQAKKTIETIRQRNFARVLAASLQDGKPCPVCGAKHHPSPADTQLELIIEDTAEEYVPHDHMEGSARDGELDCYTQQAAQLETMYSAATSAVAKLEGEFEGLQAQLQQVKDIPDLATARKHHETATKAAEKAASSYKNAIAAARQREQLQQVLSQLQAEEEPLQRQEMDCHLKTTKVCTELENLRKNVNEALISASAQGIQAPSASQAETAIKAELETTRRMIDSFRVEKQEAEKLLENTMGRLEQLLETQRQRHAESEEAERRLQATLARTGFENVAQLQEVRLSEQEAESISETVTAWRDGINRTMTLLESIEKELDGTQEQTERALRDTQNRIQETIKQQTEATETYQAAIVEKEQLSNRLKNWTHLEERRLQLHKDEELHRQLFMDIGGKRNKKIALTTWVLGIYLDEIASYASSRLNRISDGRYTLLMNQEKTDGNGAKGLDLEILDAFTGKTRPCTTLSGGEIFMASISLALALTDVVSNRAGGITLDSLFIDEGFGSLDETSLEKALSILDEIRGTRCIGLISHVAEMKSRIPAQLEVIKTSSGSTARAAFTD